MEKVQGKYETLFIVDPSLGEEGIEAVITKFNDLAYAIDKKADGYYALISFTGEPEFTTELERIFNITDGIMRSIVVRLDK